MRVRFRRPIVALLAAAGLSVSVAAISGHAAFAQTQTPTPVDTPQGSSGAVSSDSDQLLRQVTLTDKMIEGVLASQKEFDAIAEKLPETAPEKPDPKVTAQFEAVAKKYGFASYDEYNDVVDTIGLVLGGFDPATKKFVGAEAVLKAQLAEVQADKKMSAKDKKEALADLNEALKSPPPAIENKGNIDLVAKYYDKLAAALGEGEE